jgi:hypothetical protein
LQHPPPQYPQPWPRHHHRLQAPHPHKRCGYQRSRFRRSCGR